MNLSKLLDHLDTFNEPILVDTLFEILSNFKPEKQEIKKYARFDTNQYKRNDLRSSRFYEALLLCWKPLQASEIHDHKNSACGVYVIEGTMTEIPFYVSEIDPPVPQEMKTLKEGSICVSFDDDTHEILNKDKTNNLITLHIYTPPLRKIGLYKRGTVKKEQYDFKARVTS